MVMDGLKRLDEENVMKCRALLSVIFNGGIPDEAARLMLSAYPSHVLSEIILDTFNRVHGCFQFNETFFEESEE